MAVDRVSSPQSPVVSSVAEEVRRHGGSIALVPAGGLSYWLPGLSVPAGWTVVPILPESAPITRMTLCRMDPEQTEWDGCDVIALYQFQGSVPEEVVRDAATRTLHDLGAQNVLRHKVSVDFPGVTAVRSSGYALCGGTSLTMSSTQVPLVVVEHSVVVGAERQPRLARQVAELADSVHRSLSASLSGQH
jgi:hypothetical protein